ncbi:MAG: hypothetical protein A2Y62_02935 [Candidatus Fischerbacteria bacterium RBG_13_37_8]|uniref:Glycosyl transferase family 1 domain-containing protein n=1 Tax=Candidatus Fischerbacteria bacterium RBG_13_37_8 TaxID=1817863 RepID=A0A1F5VY71_9BACT|nr:MAG: hypothetical protein A2Y62_02935 [Candidatus Fischerbacteria bacterium RBG_13_37_8]
MYKYISPKNYFLKKRKIKPKVLLLGPLPPPYMGPSIATEIILKSDLNKYYTIYHINTTTHEKLSTLGEITADIIKKNVRLYFKMIFLITKIRPDLIVIPISQTVNGFIKDSIYILISRLFLRNTLLHLRGSNFKNLQCSSSCLMQIYTSKIIRSTQGIIVLGKKLRYIFANYFSDDQIFIVPNGANYAFKPRKVRNSKLNLIYLGNLQPSKGIEDVIKSIAVLKLYYGNMNFELNVAGSWLDKVTKDKCIKLCIEKELPVIFHQQVIGYEKIAFLTSADIFIFPPREPEGHPWVIIEAMAAGLPIISTDQGAITESVIDGINGFIVAKKNPEQIAEKIRFLVENPELRITMGKESRRLYEENFTEEKMVENLIHAFDSVLKS